MISLSLLVILSRIPFRGRFLYDWDSVGFALAFENYNIALHQPQPPGYISYVAMGKIINPLFHDPNCTMIFINILFSILTVLLIYSMAKQMFSRKLALITSFLLVFNPVFWFYGEIAAIYMGAAFFTTLIAYTSYQVLRDDSRFIYISAMVLGLAGGFRQDLVFFMFPLWFFCLLYKNRDYKKIIMALIVLVTSVSIWFIPTIILAGGYEKYSIVSKTLLITSFSINSVFCGADITRNLAMDFNLIGWSMIGIGDLGVFILIIFILYKFKIVFNSANIKNSKVLFILLWILPTFIFYLLVYFAKPGYILVYLPSFALVLAYVLLCISYDLNGRFKRFSKNFFIILLMLLCITSGIIQFGYTSEWTVDYGRIQYVDSDFQHINLSLGRFNSSDTLIFMDDEDNWRKIMYYFPNYETYSYYSRISAGTTFVGLRHYKNYKSGFSESNVLEVHINSSTNKILWLIDNDTQFFKFLKSKIKIHTLILPDGHEVYYSDVKNDTKFQIYMFNFIRE